MGRFNKKFILFIILIGILLLTGCNKLRFGTFNASEEDTKNEVTITPTAGENKGETNKTTSELDDNSTSDITASVEVTQAADNKSTASNIKNTANIELTVYTVNADTAEIETVTALIPEGSEITPELIVATTIESMADQSIIIETESITTKEDKVIVSFKSDKAPYSNLGSGFESAILDAIAYSLFDNLDNYKKVIYQIEGKAYSSGAFDYLIDEPYLEDN